MSDHAINMQPSLLPFADRVRVVSVGEPLRWLTEGWRDVRRSRGLSSAYAFLFLVAGMSMTLGLAAADLAFLIVPLGVAFLLAGPALIVGFYAISRDIEAHRDPALGAAYSAWRSNPGPLFALGLAGVVFVMVWLRLAALLFAISFPDVGFDWDRISGGALMTTGGLSFLVVGSVVGSVMATVAFIGAAFSLPLMLDRRVGLMEALATSATAVVLNARTMAVWGALIAVFTAVGLASWYIGLCLTLPLIGHATWHGYRAVILPPV